MSDLRDSFNYFDPDKTGFISKEHLKAILENFSMKTSTSKEIEEEIESQMTGRDDVVWKDMLTIVRKKYNMGADELDIKDLYSIFDKKGVGQADQKEFKAVLKGCLEVPTSEKDLDDMLK